MTRAEYEAIDAVNWSSLKIMARSPAHYKHGLAEPREETDFLRIGIATHAAVFEPDALADRVTRWEGRRAGGAWEEFHERETTAGRIILVRDQWDEVRTIADAVLRHPVAGPLVRGGRSEHTLTWTHRVEPREHLAGYEIACKGRLDYLRPDCIVDLKTTRDASPDAFGRQMFSLLGHGQAAWYRDGEGHALPFFFVAVEKSAPYAVQVYEVGAYLLDMGRELYRDLLGRLHACRADDSWPGYAEGIAPLEFPRWAFPFDDDISDLGLDFGAEGAAQ